MQSDPESKAELEIQNRIFSLRHPDDNLWKPALEEMREYKEKILKNEIDHDAYIEELHTIQQKWIYKQMGRDIDVNVLFDKQIEITANSVDREIFEDQCEALCLTSMIMAQYLFNSLVNTEDYQELMTTIYSKEPQDDKKRELINKVFSNFHERFDPVLKKTEEFKGITKSLVNISILSSIVSVFQYSGNDEQNLRYRNRWDNGEYPGYTCEHSIYNHIINWINTWKETALNELPSRFIQKLCGFLIMLSSMGDDYDLCKFTTETSLRISEGKITEATPQGIPSQLAAFYEEQGNLEEALKYYNMSLDAIRLINAPIWADTIIYRVALLNYQLGNKEKALEIIGRYHPDFYGNASVISMPARHLAKKLADDISIELGYTNSKQAIDNILK